MYPTRGGALTQPTLIAGGESIKSEPLLASADCTYIILHPILLPNPMPPLLSPSLRFCLRGAPLSALSRPSFSPAFPFVSTRFFHRSDGSSSIMSDVAVQLTAPNGRKYSQPIGLFINNEFVPSKSGEKFATINPSCVFLCPALVRKAALY